MSKTLRPDLFAVNPNPDLSVHNVGLGQHKVIIADHFYLYPDDILQTALELPYTDRFEIVGNFPGVRASLNMNTQPLIEHLSQIWGCTLSPFFFSSARRVSGHQDAEFPLKRRATSTPHRSGHHSHGVSQP